MKYIYMYNKCHMLIQMATLFHHMLLYSHLVRGEDRQQASVHQQVDAHEDQQPPVLRRPGETNRLPRGPRHVCSHLLLW